jgi:predicted phage terminase large subunit-like protein
LIEKARREKARRNFGVWLARVSPTWTWDWAWQRYAQGILQQVTDGELRKVMLNLPPQHGKSSLVTERYSVYRLACDPSHRVGIGSYNQDFANRFGRRTRRIALEAGIDVSGDSKSVSDWETPQQGGLVSVGVGSGITGRPLDGLVIDDPVKSRKEAESLTYRNAVYDWYTDDLYTRLQQDSWIVLIMCMVGDTPVLMADGTERPLRDIRVGDEVATYDNGTLATSVVRNHRSNGLDSVLRIKTICGRIVYANERHPFLVEEHGQLKWIRTRDLTTGHRIVTVRDNGASGRGRHAASKVARSRLAHGVTALRTMLRRCGQTGIARRHSMQSRTVTPVSSIGMALPVQSTMRCTKRKTAGVLSASSRPVTTFAPIGAGSCALTTATTPTPFGGFCATIATLLWGTPRQKRPHSPLPNTSDFTTEAIAAIDPAGTEEVFDLQIERTENFIANGIVSHNTRWHEDDLAGRILASEDAPNWTVVNLPAEAEENDPLGRPLGAPLCPERFDAAALADKRTVLGSYGYNALYQGRPSPREGGMLKRHWFEIVGASPATGDRVRWWDLAATIDGDYTVGVRMCRAGGVYYVEDVRRVQATPHAVKQLVSQTAAVDGQACKVWMEQEPGSAGVNVIDSYTRVLAGYAFHGERATGAKEVRAEAFAAQAEAGNVKLVKADWNAAYLDELAAFPNGANDDQVDATTGAFNKLALPDAVPHIWFAGS